MLLPHRIAALMLTAGAVCAYGREQSLDSRMEAAGLEDVCVRDTSLRVEMLYSGPHNFVGRTLYPPSLTRAWLHPDAAQALALASAELQKLRPDLRIKITDAARPMSVQRAMYRTVKGTSKARYVSNPANGGGMHNYGVAVDVTLVDLNGRELPMGTPVDHLGPEAHIDREEDMVRRGTITRQEMANRQLLRSVMTAGGFTPLTSEWWHFNLCSRPEAKRRYRVLDF